jgi:hypothetical protein
MEITMANNVRKPTKTNLPKTTRVKTAPVSRRGPTTKKEIATALLRRPKGATLTEMQRAMGWQAHSVRGFLATTVKKMPGVTLVSEKAQNELRRYRIEATGE